MNPNAPAFPPPAYIDDRGNWNNPSSCGMSVRLYIATQALQGLLSGTRPVVDTEQRLFAQTALSLADAILAAEAKHPKP